MAWLKMLIGSKNPTLQDLLPEVKVWLSSKSDLFNAGWIFVYMNCVFNVSGI